VSGPAVPKLGIIAGSGTLPGLLAAACRAEGRPFYVLGLTGFADAATLGAEPNAWIRLGEAPKGFTYLREAGVGTVVMAGGVRRPSLAELRHDLKATAFFARIAARALGDDGVLRAVIAEIEREGFAVVAPDEVLKDLLAAEGALGQLQPDGDTMADISHGFEVARALGRLDIGQAVVVQQGVILGVEAAEGTAALIARCGPLQHPGRRAVLVKARKPQQDRRVDLPAIGPDTVAQVAAAGLQGIAVEAGGSLVLGRAAVAAAADRAGVFVVGAVP